MTIGERIRKRRIELNINPKDIAEKIGKSVSTYYRYETNDIEKLTIENLSMISECLKVSPVYLLFGIVSENEKDVSSLPDSNHYIVKGFSRRLTELKKSENITTSDIAILLSDRSEHDISEEEIENWETGKNLPDLISFVTLCEFFEVSCEYMLGTEIQHRNTSNTIYKVAETPDSYKKQSYLVTNVKYLLDSCDMSVSEIALKTGISKKKIAVYMNGQEDDIPMPDLKAISELLQIPMVDILFKKDTSSIIDKLSMLDAVDIKIVEDYIDNILSKK